MSNDIEQESLELKNIYEGATLECDTLRPSHPRSVIR